MGWSEAVRRPPAVFPAPPTRPAESEAAAVRRCRASGTRPGRTSNAGCTLRKKAGGPRQPKPPENDPRCSSCGDSPKAESRGTPRPATASAMSLETHATGRGDCSAQTLCAEKPSRCPRRQRIWVARPSTDTPREVCIRSLRFIGACPAGALATTDTPGRVSGTGKGGDKAPSLTGLNKERGEDNAPPTAPPIAGATQIAAEKRS